MAQFDGMTSEAAMHGGEFRADALCEMGPKYATGRGCSIDLVAAVVQRRLGGPDERAWAWAEAAQRRFLDAYLAEVGEGARGTLLDTSAIPGLMAEQLLLELSYAERYLPVWRYAPDGAIARRYPRESAPNTDENDETESPWSPPASPRI